MPLLYELGGLLNELQPCHGSACPIDTLQHVPELVRALPTERLYRAPLAAGCFTPLSFCALRQAPSVTALQTLLHGPFNVACERYAFWCRDSLHQQVRPKAVCRIPCQNKVADFLA